MTERIQDVTTINNQKMQEAWRQYEEDGAAVLRGVIEPAWIARLSEGTERLLVDKAAGVDLGKPGEGRFFNSLFAWLRIPEYRAFVLESGVGALAAEIMRSSVARFFYDQPLIKEPGSLKRTPWHQDLPYWPCSGEQIVSFWVPLDPATPENGVVTYVRGSHRWDAFFPMENWSDQGNFDALQGEGAVVERAGRGATDDQSRTLADIRDHPEKYEFVTWNVEPGDVIVHHAKTIHGAAGNATLGSRRRAIAFRFVGDDAKWDETRPHSMRMLRKNPAFPYPALETGDPMVDDTIFPVVWPTGVASLADLNATAERVIGFAGSRA